MCSNLIQSDLITKQLLASSKVFRLIFKRWNDIAFGIRQRIHLDMVGSKCSLTSLFKIFLFFQTKMIRIVESWPLKLPNLRNTWENYFIVYINNCWINSFASIIYNRILLSKKLLGIYFTPFSVPGTAVCPWCQIWKALQKKISFVKEVFRMSLSFLRYLGNIVFRAWPYYSI